MTRITFSLFIASGLFAFCLAAGPAAATVDHTYISGKGADSGGCISQGTACRSFAYAIAQTTAGGEIIVMDAADYSPVTITKSISIVADAGGPAGIVVATGDAITVSAGSADVVNLRGLTLDGEGTAANGINLQSAGAVTISDCFARHFAGAGISVGSTTVSILHSVTNDNGTGLAVVGAGGAARNFVTIRNSVANNNGTGFYLFGATVTFAGSMATGNSQYGIRLATHGAQPEVFSYGDNEINGNLNNVSGGSLIPVAKL
jgi:Right handed beta helix region